MKFRLHLRLSLVIVDVPHVSAHTGDPVEGLGAVGAGIPHVRVHGPHVQSQSPFLTEAPPADVACGPPEGV